MKVAYIDGAHGYEFHAACMYTALLFRGRL